ncbi:MAG: LacI family DNA-binding transcriptional regulator [Vallitaleaceae bacterium]|jgi:LacI family transcriptional regulator|nr:LacI family DNA-binding transcriptional regulator [Vallitaleaceae bacterium]
MKSEDIAKLAGVSRSTVSRVVNNYPNVPTDTKEKVMNIIKEYNYSPNTYARTLAGKKSNTIGLFLIIEGDFGENNRIYMNDFFGAYLDLLLDYASIKDYYVLVSIISSESKYQKIQQAFLEKRIDAGVIIGTQLDTLKKIHMDTITSSVVLFDYDLTDKDRVFTKDSHISTINSNDYEGIKDAVRHLYSKGHRSIGFIKGRELSRSGHIRYEAYLSAMSELDLDVNADHIIEGEFDIGIAYANTQKMLKDCEIKPTAIISANDFMALAAIDAIHEANLDVPGDISIIGFDNTLHGQISDPKLTTIGPDFKIMAQKAIDILDKQIQGIYPSQEVNYEVNFYERDTCQSITLEE